MRTNPVYKRETMVSARSFKLALLLLSFNGILAFVAFLNMYSTLAQVRVTAEIQYTSFLDLYLFVATLEFAMLVLIMPAITAGSISGERERQTLELMLTTRMRPVDIVLGKLEASISTMGLMIMSSFPIIALVFVYGGVTVGDIAVLLLCFAAAALFAGSIGICCSALFGRTTLATVASYAILAAVVVGSCGLNQFVSYINGMRLGSYLSSAVQVSARAGSGSFLYLLLINPALTFILAISRLTGRAQAAANVGQWFGNRATGPIFSHWVVLSIVLQLVTAAALIWIAVRAVENGKKR